MMQASPILEDRYCRPGPKVDLTPNMLDAAQYHYDGHSSSSHAMLQLLRSSAPVLTTGTPAAARTKFSIRSGRDSPVRDLQSALTASAWETAGLTDSANEAYHHALASVVLETSDDGLIGSSANGDSKCRRAPKKVLEPVKPNVTNRPLHSREKVLAILGLPCTPGKILDERDFERATTCRNQVYTPRTPARPQTAPTARQRDRSYRSPRRLVKPASRPPAAADLSTPPQATAPTRAATDRPRRRARSADPGAPKLGTPARAPSTPWLLPAERGEEALGGRCGQAGGALVNWPQRQRECGYYIWL